MANGNWDGPIISRKTKLNQHPYKLRSRPKLIYQSFDANDSADDKEDAKNIEHEQPNF